jgi:hypothetical protein
MMKNRIGIIGIAAAILLTGVFSIEAGAQTRRKRKPARRPAVTAPVLPPTGEAQIISQAGDSTLLDPNALSQPLASSTTPTNDPVSESSARYIADLEARIKQLEGAKATPSFEEKQKRMLLNLDIITRAEQRSESIRKQLFDLTEKETNLKTRIDQIDADMRPESINAATIFGGSLRPEETREARRKSLQAEKTNLTALIGQVQTTRASLERNLERSDLLIERLRQKLEKDIDDSLKADDPQP